MEQVSTAEPDGTLAESEEQLHVRWQTRQSTHSTALAAGLVAVVGLPAWSLFDHLVEPAMAWNFTLIRLIATIPIVLCWGLLFTPIGQRRPELPTLGILAAVQVAIAVMIVQLDSSHEAYALGMSLAIYAGGLLIVWELRYTAALVAISAGALAVGWLLADPIEVAAIASVAFYIGTASAIAMIGQALRQRARWSEFQARSALEAEQARSRELVDKLDRLSHEDSLTGLANRRAWDQAIERECAKALRGGGTVSVLLCDLDRLKDINDNFGHAMGDVVLQAVADLLRERTRAADLVARIGGDEFAILSASTDEVGAANLAEDLRYLVDHEEPGGPGLGPVTLSIGVAEWEGPDDSARTLQMRADRRLYVAKAKRNVVVAGDPTEIPGL